MATYGTGDGARRSRKRGTVSDDRKSKVDAFMQLARKRFQTAANAEEEDRREQQTDKEFRAGEQWDPTITSLRSQQNRPCITINLLPGFVRQVVNQARQARPAIQINPVDSGADPDTAEVFQGIIRNIEITSDASAAYDTAQEHAAEMGIGFWRITNPYEDEDSFDQTLQIDRIRNRFSVFCDPSKQRLDFRDMGYAFITSDVLREEFEEEYGEDAVKSLELFAMANERVADWMPTGRVRVAEYFYKKKEAFTLAKISIPPPKLAPKSTPPRIMNVDKAILDFNDPAMEGIQVLKERESTRVRVCWAKINGCEILEGNDDKTEGRIWPGKYIPIIPVIGEEIDVNGKVGYRGMIRDGRGPQRMINFWASQIAEVIGTAPRSPYIAEVSQIAEFQDVWNTLNTVPYSVLPYRGKALEGRPLPPPQRNMGEPPIQAMVQGYTLADAALKAVIGLYDPSLGAPGNERSGKAILARQERSDLGTSHHQSNFARSIRFTGEQLVDLIPKVITSERIMRIMGADEHSDPRTVVVHAGQFDAQAANAVQGLAGIYNVNAGRYDVTVTTGPSYQSRRQESVDAMIELVRAYPQAFPIVGDILAGNMDWPGAREIAARLKRVLPPQVLGNENVQIPPEAQQQITQLTTQLQQLAQQFQQAKRIIDTDAQKLASEAQIKQMEISSRERIALGQNQVELIKTQAEINFQKAETMIKAELQSLATLLEHRQASIDNQTQLQLAAMNSRGDANATTGTDDTE